MVATFGVAGLGFGVYEAFLYFSVLNEDGVPFTGLYVMRALYCAPFHAALGLITGGLVVWLLSGVKPLTARILLLPATLVPAVLLHALANALLASGWDPAFYLVAFWLAFKAASSPLAPASGAPVEPRRYPARGVLAILILAGFVPSLTFSFGWGW